MVDFVTEASRSGNRSGDQNPLPFRAYTEREISQIPHLAGFSPEQRFAMEVVAQVLPFRVNSYILDSLIDWNAAPDDPMFRLVFPHPDMLSADHFQAVADQLRGSANPRALAATVWRIRTELNPHPAGQLTLNVPKGPDGFLAGTQHKYPETVLFFPNRSQTCHAFCSFCYRWAQFVGNRDLRIASDESAVVADYIRTRPEVTDLLVTGGDPFIMEAHHLTRYMELFLGPGLDHLRSIRIGTKTLTYWPWRFVSDPDADDLLRLIERFVRAGKHVSIMAHFDHWRELEPPVVAEAIRRLRGAGAVIRCQAPLLAHINDDPAVWARLWQAEISLGAVPYYLFVARNTGARRGFQVPLHRAWSIFRDAYAQVSGLARTVRGPSMSCEPGKIQIDGVAEVGGEKVFALRFLQARRPEWVGRPFFARFDPEALWFDDLKPAFGEHQFFFEKTLCAEKAMRVENTADGMPRHTEEVPA